MPRKQNNFIGTCWHEAGHAVVAVARGLSITEVTVRPADDYNGCCVHPSLLLYDVTSRSERRRLARDCIVASYAGIEAERLFDPDAPEHHAEEDFQNAFDTSREYGVLPRYCSYVGDDVHDEFLRRLRAEARRLVRRYRPQIELVAAALAKRKTLTGEQVAETIRKIPLDI